MRKKPPESLVVMGRILAPYGVRGWVKIRPYTEATNGLLAYPNWWIGEPGEWSAETLVEGQEHSGMLVAHLEGVDDRDKAASLRGKDIAVAREDLPPAPDGEYYWADLVGLAVRNREDVDLGRVAEIFATGANDVLVVRNGRERLIPVIASVIVEVDLTRKSMVVDWDADF